MMPVFGRGAREDVLAAWLAEQPFGDIERRVPLGGELKVGEAHARPVLVQSPLGVWVAAAHEDGGVAIDLLEEPGLRLDLGVRRGRLVLSRSSFEVPFGSAGKVQAALAHGRLCRVGAERQPLPEPDRHVHKAAPLAEDWLSRWLEPGEEVLAWLDTATSTTFDTIAKASGAYRYLLTCRRHVLVAVSDVGDVLVHALPSEPLRIASQVGRDGVQVGVHTWLALRRNEDRYREIAELPALQTEDRLRELARLRWLARDKKGKGVERALALLELGVDRSGDPRARLARAWIRASSDGGEEVESPMAVLLSDERGRASLAAVLDLPEAGEALALWCDRWAVGGPAAEALVAQLRSQGEQTALAALPAHRWSHKLAIEGVQDVVLIAQADAALASHAIEVGEIEEAAVLLEGRLASLPASSLDELIGPDDDAEAAAVYDAHRARIRLLELLASATGGVSRAEALAELARLAPLDGGRIDDARAAAEGDLAERLGLVRSLLRDFPRSAAVTEKDAAPAVRALPERLVDEVLRHPATREGEQLGQLQRLLSREVDLPDYEEVRAYGELAVDSRFPELLGAVADARVLLGVEPGIEVFVKRVGSTVGLRVHEGPSPFLLVGLDHLDPKAPLHLRPAELRFRVGAEVAHLAFGHARLTARNLWDELFEHAPKFLDLLLDLAPLVPLKGVWAAGAQLAGKLPLQKLLPTRPSAASVAELNLAWRDLLTACRLMQLTADRAGLLLCDDLLAATRGIFLSSRENLDDLALAERHGLVIALHRRGPGHTVLPTPLALRVAALWSFYLSEDWTRLRAAVRGPSA